MVVRILYTDEFLLDKRAERRRHLDFGRVNSKTSTVYTDR